MTERMNELMENLFLNQEKLLQSNDVRELMKIHEITPAFYYNRLIYNLDQNSEFARFVRENNNDENVDEILDSLNSEVDKFNSIRGRQIINARNSFINTAINNNIIGRTKKMIYYNEILNDKHNFIIAQRISKLTYEERKSILAKVAEETFVPRKFTASKALISNKRLREDWNIDTDNNDFKVNDETSNELVLEKYNELKKKAHDIAEKKRKKEYIESYIETYINTPLLWSKKAICYANETYNLFDYKHKNFETATTVIFNHLKICERDLNIAKDKQDIADDENLLQLLQTAKDEFGTDNITLRSSESANKSVIKVYPYNITKYKGIYLRDEELVINGIAELYHIIDFNGEEIYITAKNDDLLTISDEQCNTSLVKDKLYSNSLILNPYKTFKDIYTILTDSSNASIEKNIDRYKAFLVALTFNLTYEQLIEIMSRTLGLTSINFKDPYEVILAYCLKEHTNVCERYFDLMHLYQNEYNKLENKITNNDGTRDCELRFNQIDSDEDLVKFLLTMPTNFYQKTALKKFNEIFKSIAEYTSNKKKEDYIDDKAEKMSKYWSYESVEQLLHTDERLNKIYERKEVISNSVAIKSIIDVGKINSGAFAQFKKATFSERNIDDILNGTIPLTKEHFIQICFIEYCLADDGWVYFWDECNDKNIIRSLFEDFTMYCNNIFKENRFDNIYLPNLFERIIIFCLLTEDPISTFNYICELEK